jgi:hypothetical protein
VLPIHFVLLANRRHAPLMPGVSIVFLPDCNSKQIHLVLDRLSLLAIEIQAKKVPFGFSAGFADYREGETSAELLQRADCALYAQKQIRKNPTHPACKAGFSMGGEAARRATSSSRRTPRKMFIPLF